MSLVNLTAKDYNIDTDQYRITASDFVLNSASYFTGLVSCTGARVVTNGARITIQKLGRFTQFVFQPQAALITLTAAADSTLITFTGVIPVGFRPTQDVVTSIIVGVNNLPVGGCYCLLSTTGNIIIAAGPGFTASSLFTTGQLCGVPSTIMANYV